MNKFVSKETSSASRLQPLSEIRTEIEKIGLPSEAALQAEENRRAREAAARGDFSKIEAQKAQCETMIGFTEYRFPRYRTARHHRLIAELGCVTVS
jgi:hypothetical protein